MTKSIIVIFLFIFIFAIILAASTNNNNIPDEDKANFGITKFIQTLLGRLQNFFFGSKNDNTNNQKNDVNTSDKPLENKDLLQGDIMLTEQQADNIVEKVAEEAASNGVDISKVLSNETDVRLKRSFRGDRKKWGSPIDYQIIQGDADLIQKALQLMEKKTCIRFNKVYWTVVGKASLKYFRGKGCWSYIGRIQKDKPQDVSIGYGCDTIGKIQHETMHALGIEHEQNRADRDKYIKILHENINALNIKNYVKLEDDNAVSYGIPYDYGSDMQYSAHSFTFNGKETMLPYNGLYNKTLGMDSGMTFLDAKLVNLHYCANKCPTPMKCYNSGYQNPNECGRCVCVKGYGGKRCTKLATKRKEGCGDPLYYVTEKNQTLTLNGKNSCLYHLKAPHGQKIKIRIHNVTAYPTWPKMCMKANSLEVKFYADKSVTGALFCGIANNTEVVTQNDHGIVHLKSQNEKNFMNLTFSLY